MSAGIKHVHIDYVFDKSHKLPYVHGPKVAKMLEDIGDPLKPKPKIDHKHDIPYLCGYSLDGGTVFLDKDFDPIWRVNGKEVDTTPFLITHEITEERLLNEEESEEIPEEEADEGEDEESLDYQQAHHIATFAERKAVEAAELDWADYTAFMTKAWHKAYAKWTGPKRSDLAVPDNLDMEPYEDEHDTVLKRMYDAGAPDKEESEERK